MISLCSVLDFCTLRLILFICFFQAHCLSQWGHNFRPSYLRLRSLLPLIEPKSILALTATAGPLVVRDICNTLCIPYDGHTTEDRPPSPEAPIEVLNNDADMNMDSDGGGVKVLNCDRDNIDVFSLVLQNNDERRYLVSFKKKTILPFVRYPSVVLTMLSLFTANT